MVERFRSSEEPKEELKEKIPLSPTIITFGGQGSLKVGADIELCKIFPDAKNIYRTADDIITSINHESLKTEQRRLITDISFNGPQEELDLTINSQPATFTHNYACQKALEAKGLIKQNITLVTGHSLGLYNALVAAGVIDFSTAFKLVNKRGPAMADANKINPGALLVVLLSDKDPMLAEVLDRFKLEIALINTRDQTVIGGNNKKIKEALQWLGNHNKKGVILPVEGAPHTSLMEPAVEILAETLETTELKPAKIPIIANTSARPIQTIQEIKEELLKQLVHTVLYRESMEYTINQGITTALEVGNDGTLSRMNVKNFGGTIADQIKLIGNKFTHAAIWQLNPQTTTI